MAQPDDAYCLEEDNSRGASIMNDSSMTHKEIGYDEANIAEL
jgi:hypothetical protein